MAKANGLTEPTIEEKDPAVLALRVTALEKISEELRKAHVNNLNVLHQAMSMVDMHQQVLQRIVRELTYAIHSGANDHIASYEDGRLNIKDYYDRYRDVIEAAGERYAEIAVVYWSQGYDQEDAIERAKVAIDKREESDPTPDPDYEVEHFGGTDDKGSHEQVTAG